MTEKIMPEVHLGHHIGPAPTSAEMGLFKKPCDHIRLICHIRGNQAVWNCADCGAEVERDSFEDTHCPECGNLYALDKDGKKFCLECGHNG